MSLRRTWVLGRAMFLGFIRDGAAFFFTLVFPLLFLVIFGLILSGDEGTNRFAVLVTGDGPVIAALPDEVLDISRVASLSEGVDRVGEGDAVAVVAQDGDRVVVRFQASNQVGGQAVLGIVSAVVDDANLEALGGQETYALQADQVEDASLGTIEFFTPGVLAWAISLGAVFGAGLTLVNWRTKGVLRRLRLTPVPAAEVATARIALSLIVAVVQTVVFLAVGVTVFGLNLAGPSWMVLPVVMAGTIAFLGIGLLVGAVAKTVESASVIANLIVLPMAFLSGAFFPLDAAPGWVRVVSRAVPLTYLLDALRDVTVRDQPALSVVPHMAILVGIGAAFAFAATRLFRWDQA